MFAFNGFSKLHRLCKSVSPKMVKNLLVDRHCSSTINEVTQLRMCTSSSSQNTTNFSLLTKGDPDLEHKLKVLMLEVEVMKQEGKLVPDSSFMTNKHWQELMNCQSMSARRKYLEFLFKLSKTKENRMIKKEQKRKEWEENRPEKKVNETYEEFVAQYDLAHNTIFLRFYDSTINNLYNNRLVQAMQFGQKLVVDCGYDKNMTKRENSNCAKQLMLLFSENRMHDDPYDLYYCNSNFKSSLMENLKGFISTMHEPWFPLNVHEASYLDLFPKEQLVYLTPHCREELTSYDHDAIYIIGAIVDKVNNEPLSLAKAKKEGIRMAKLPLDRYLQWGAGSGKSLTLNQVTSILLDMKKTGDWKYALRHVPQRKIVQNLNQQSKNTPHAATSFNNRSQKWKPTKYSDQTFKNDKKGRLIKMRSILYD